MDGYDLSCAPKRPDEQNFLWKSEYQITHLLHLYTLTKRILIMSNDDHSRRDALGTGAAAIVAGVGAALAVSTMGRDAEAQTSPADATKLNALLRAEYDAILTYGAAESYLMMPDPSDDLRAIAPKVLIVARSFREDHTAHVAKLQALVTMLGGTPLGRGEVVTPMLPAGFRATVINLLRLASDKEKKAAIAYTDTLKTISTSAAAELVAAIGGVEAMHFTLLYLAAKNILIPGMMDAALASLAPAPFVALSDASATAQTISDPRTISSYTAM
jgi:hypothetical protein